MIPRLKFYPTWFKIRFILYYDVNFFGLPWFGSTLFISRIFVPLRRLHSNFIK